MDEAVVVELLLLLLVVGLSSILGIGPSVIGLRAVAAAAALIEIGAKVEVSALIVFSVSLIVAVLEMEVFASGAADLFCVSSSLLLAISKTRSSSSTEILE